MNWDNLQNRMQQDASQKEVKVDIDEIWAAIEPEVDVINQERRKKRFPLFWMLGLGLAITLGGLFYMFYNNTPSDANLVDFEKMEKHTDEHSHEHAHTHAAIDNPSKVEENKEGASKEKVLNEVDFGKNEVPVEAHSDATAEVNNQLTVEESIQRELDRLENPVFGLTESDATEEISNSDNEINNFSTKNENNKVSQVIGSNHNNKITEDKLPWKISQSDQEVQSTNELNNSDLILSNVSNDKTSSIVQLDEKEEKVLLNISKLSMLTLALPTIEKDLLPTTQISNYYTALTKEEIKEILSKGSVPPYNNAPKFTFSLGLMGGIGSAPNTLTAKNDTVSSLLLIRRETESSLETSQFGLSFSLRHESGIHLSTGLQQTTFVEKVAFNDMVTTTKDVDGIVQIIVNPDGDSTFITGLVTETTVSTIEKKHYVRYKLWEVPLIVGWQTKDKSNTGWKFGVEAGIVPNLRLTTKGRIFNEEYDDVDIGTNQGTYFKKNVGLSYHLGFSVRRMLTDNIELSLKPTVRFFPKDFSATGNNIAQKYNLVSGQVGVSYIFGN